ncbi:MAG TPA: PDZ domain-containing protein [Candidatus Acidoferrales bacterium]|nr:PDZ domain-containing protein [Candidatus Acidoferrales bacterium]
MRCQRFLIDASLVVGLVASAVFSAALALADSAPPPGSIASQGTGGAETPRLPAGQPTDSATLEIAPQPTTLAPANKADDLQHQPAPREGEDIATLNKNWHPPDRDDRDDGRVPYLGIELESTTECYLGMEEHGFEVVRVYPNSPADRAGLHARTASTPLGDFESLAIFTIPMLRRSGALGMDGDLIIAVDDRRVRTEHDVEAALDRLRPGDTTYITVIRPEVGGGHRTMRVALHVDQTIKAAPN